MSLTPFIRHELEHQPGTAAAPENSCTRCSPPLGKEPDILLPGDPAAPGTQVPPQIETPGQTPHPDTNSAPQGVPMTNGTPAACYQKNAREFLAGDVQTSVMAHYAPAQRFLSVNNFFKIFQIIFALPVEICVRFPYYGSKQR